MAPSKPEPSAWPGKPAGTDTGGMFRSQKIPPRPRPERVQNLDAGPVTRSKPGRENPSQQSFITGIKTFILFLAAMVIILVLSMKGLNMVWSAKDRKIMSSSGSTVTETRAPYAPDTAASVDSEEAEPTIEVKPRPDSNSQAMRKALLLVKRADSLAASGFDDEAIMHYREALSTWPYLSSVWVQLGRLYLRANDYPHAQAALEKAASSDAKSADVLNDLGVVYMYQERPDKAIPCFESAIGMDPEYSACYFNLALCYLERSDKASAREALGRFLLFHPDDARALRECAYLDASSTNYVEAMNALQRAIKQSPDWPLLYLDAGAVAALMGKPDEAIDFLKKAEPLTSAAVVYRLYQEETFAAVRQSERGIAYNKDLSARAERKDVDTQAIKPTLQIGEPVRSVEPAAQK